MAGSESGPERARATADTGAAAGAAAPADPPSFLPDGVNGALLAYLSRRRSVAAASLGEPGPDGETLARMVEIAARVPDHGKLAPWRFVAFRGEARRRAGEAFARILAGRDGITAEDTLQRERERFTRAPVVVAVVSRAAPHPKIPEWEQVLSAGAAALNLVHAANAFGFSANWLTEWIAYDEEARAALGLSEDERIAAFVHIGTAAAVPGDRARPDLSTILTVEDG